MDAQVVHPEEKSELAALKQQLAAIASFEETLRQDADVFLREQVAKAYQYGLGKAGPMASGRSLSHY